MTKVIHFITELSIGGAQMALYRLVTHLPADYSVHVVCLYNGNGLVAEKLGAAGVPVTDLGMTSRIRLDAFVRLFRLLHQEKPDILHTWMFHANVPGRLLGRLARIPVIISAERTMGQENRLRQFFNRATVSLAHAIICVSQNVADYASQVIGLPRHKLQVVPNGIDLNQHADLPTRDEARQSLGLPTDAFVVGAVGRPRPVKGFNYLLSAWPAIAASGDAHLLFVGDGPNRSQLEMQTSHLSVSDSVSFLGDRADVPRLLPAFDVLVLPSLHEGMPNVALEAMAAGLPVIATAVGGTPEVVIAGETGLLVPPQDITALAQAILRIKTDPDYAHQLGANGRSRVQAHFSLEKTVELTVSLYQSLLSSRL